MDYNHVKKQLCYGIQTESKYNAIKAIEQLQARVAELEAENAKLHEQVDLQVPKMAFTQLKAANDAQAAVIEKEPSVESGGEFKTWWEIALHVGAWKNHKLDYVHFGSEMAVRAFAIHLLKQRDKEESQLIQTIAKLTAERDALKKLYESSEEYVIALKETRNRLAEERDKWRSKHDVACLTITNLQSKYECQLSATSKALQGVVELTAEAEHGRGLRNDTRRN